MKAGLILVLACVGALSACKPKEVKPPSVGRVWKAALVKENGTVVFEAGNTGSTRPGYARFRLDLTRTEEVVYTDLDGRRLTGTWSFSTDNRRLILENLSPPPSASVGNLEFYLSSPPTNTTMMLKRTNESRKTGNTVNEYELVPE